MFTARRLAWGSSAVACLLGIAAAAPPPDEPFAWAAGPLDVVVALPRAADAEAAVGLVDRKVPYYAEAAKRTDPPLGSLRIAAARVDDGGRTLRLTVDPQPLPARYVLNLEPLGEGEPIVYGLRGVEAARVEGDDPTAEAEWTAWLPTIDPAGLADLANRSAEHARRLPDLAKPGLLRLDTQVDLPVGEIAATVESTAEIVGGFFGDDEPEGGVSKTANGRWVAKFAFDDAPRPAFLSLTIRTGPDAPAPSVKLTAGKPGEPARAPEASAYLPPWVSAALAASQQPAPMDVPDLTGGDPKRGEEVYFNAESQCAQCHVVNGRGTAVGPDLTTIGLKGAEFIYRSIVAPSETIAPDYVSYTISLDDGRVATGIVRAEGADAIRVVGADGKSTVIPRDEIEELRPAATSIMPVGLAPVLGEQRMRDLIAYLTAAARKQ